MKNGFFKCPLESLKLDILYELFPESRSVALDIGIPVGLFSTNALCLYLYRKVVNSLESESNVVKWLLWEHETLMPCVSHFVTAQKLSNVGLLESTKRNVEDCLQFLQSSLDRQRACLVSTSTGEPSLPDILIWTSLLPVSHLIGSNPSFGSIKTWSIQLGGKHAFLQAQTHFKIKTYEASFIKQSERQSVHMSGSHSNEVISSSKESNAQKVQSKGNSGIKAGVTMASNWVDSNVLHQMRPNRVAPVLPEDGKKNVLITSALPYVNNIPHLGNIIGCVLSADVYSRYCRSMGYNSVYICGTDEYGTATETKALEEKVSPKEICDKYFAIHRDVYSWFNISFDYFGRTTTPYQTQISQDIFWKLDQNGYLVEQAMEQLKCDACDRFLADRFVEGECPHCGYADARGDQCDACAKLVDANKLKNPRCKICSAKPRLTSSNHLFLNLPLLEGELSKELASRMDNGVWTDCASNITNAWLRDGLKARCITRDLKWGTPVPKEPFTDKVFYVWFDAPIGYISITANYCGDKWPQWWKNPEQVEMFNFMAKDNVPFHSVIFPCTLIGARDGYGIVNNLVAVEYLNYEDGKFSKSRNVGVFGNNAQDSGIPADVFRFYLLFIRPESQDSTFSWIDFATKSNSELLNNLGNFINRALSFCFNSFAAVVQKVDTLDAVDEELIDNVNKELTCFIECMEKVKIRDALTKILNVSRFGNGYIQSTQPWVLNKSPDPKMKARAGAINAICVNIVHLCAQMLEPFMPQTAFEVFKQLNLYSSADDQNGLPKLPTSFIRAITEGHKINKPSPLFKKLEEVEILKLKEMYGGGAMDAGKDPNVASVGQTVEALKEAVTNQGNKVRLLKAAKPQDKQLVAKEVEVLKKLKSDLETAEKAKTDKKDARPPSGGIPVTPLDALSTDQLPQMVQEQGDKVRTLKGQKPQNKEEIAKEVEVLKQLKASLEQSQKAEPSQPVLAAAKPSDDTKVSSKIESELVQTPNKRGETATEEVKAVRKDPNIGSSLSPKEGTKGVAEVNCAPATPVSSSKSADQLESSVSSSGGSSGVASSAEAHKKKRKRNNKKK